MTTPVLVLSVVADTADGRSMTLLLLATLITLTLGAIRWLSRRAHVIMVISGTSVMLVILTVLFLAYLITYGAV